MLTFTTFSLWLHLTAVAVWVGGLFAVAFVFVPALGGGLAPGEAGRLGALVAQRFQRISREIILLILLTGIFNLINAGVARGFDFSAAYVRLLIIKIAFFVGIVAIQAWHSFHVAPAMARVTSGMERPVDPVPAAVKRLQRRALVISILNLVLAASVIFLGLILRYR